jgi:trimeric autotransporter adhesin
VGHEVNNGNLLGLVSSYKGADGQDHAMADVWFAKAQPTAEAPPALSELLVADSGTLLGGAPAATAEATRTAAGHHGTMLLSRLPGISDEELLRQQQPLF